MRKLFYCFVYLLFSFESLAQRFTVAGTVKDATTNEPIKDATVFVVNTSNTTKTNEKGEFLLLNLPLGTTSVAVLKNAYEPLRQVVRSEQATQKMLDLVVNPLSEVQNGEKVALKRDKKWEKLSKRFLQALIGEGILANDCVLLNPEVINYTEEGNKLTAQTIVPLDIENRAMGYRLQYVLTKGILTENDLQYQGYARFEALQPESIQQEQQWLSNRNFAYGGSERHFFASLANPQADSPFAFYVDKPGGSPSKRSKKFNDQLGKTIEAIALDTLLRKGKIEGEWNIKLPKIVEIHYKSDFLKGMFYDDTQKLVSWMEGVRDISFTKNGVVQTSAAFVTVGFLNTKRLASFLPIDFVPSRKAAAGETLTLEKQQLVYKLQERIDIKTNKHYFHPGENIWLAGEIQHIDTSMQNALSKLVYVEFISPDNKIIQRLKLLGSPLQFKGMIAVKDNLPTGEYRIRAYTNWMRNFGDSTFFNQVVPIVSNKQYVVAAKNNNIEKIKTKITDKEVYKSRELVTVSLDKSLLGGSLVVLDTLDVLGSSVENFGRKLPFDKLETFKKMPEFKFFSESGIRISGTVKNPKGEVFPDTPLLFLLGNTQNTAMSGSDETGKFELNGLQVYDSVTYNCKVMGGKNKDLTIDVDPEPTSPVITTLNNKPAYEIKERKSALLIGADIDLPKDAILLDELAVKGKKSLKKQVEVKPIYGNADFTVKGSDIMASARGMNPILALQGKVPGVRIVDGADGKITVNIRGNSSFTGTSEPLYLIDGTPVDNVYDLNAIPFDRIDRIEVLKTARAMFGSRGANGVIAIYTKNAVDRTSEGGEVEGMKTYKLLGISQQADFKSPNYKTELTSSPDLRTTIFWQPQIKDTQLSFYTADDPGTYKIQIKNADKTYEYLFEVR